MGCPISALSFQKETVEGCIEEAGALLRQHFSEVAAFRGHDLEPNLPQYLQGEREDRFHVFTVREDKKLVGYAGFWVNQHPQQVSLKTALCDLVYLLPEKRNEGHGKRFLAYCEEELTKEGVNGIFHEVVNTHDYSHVLSALGYNPKSTIYAKEVSHDRTC